MTEDNPDRTISKKDLDDLEAENALLREALEAVEWVWVADDDGLRLPKCPWCGGLRWKNLSTEKFQVAHAPDCLRQEALK